MSQPEIGDVVLYHFKSYIRFGASETEIRTRPAIITSIVEPPGRGDFLERYPGEHTALNLYVFFEDADYITPAQRQLREGWGPQANERRGVRSRPARTPDDASDNTWSTKPDNRPRNWVGNAHQGGIQ